MRTLVERLSGLLAQLPSNARCAARRASAAWCRGPLVLGIVLAASPLAQEREPLELRRDQEEIVAKMERLKDLVQKLLQRYRAEDRIQQVKLLEEGLRHLEQVQLLEDVAEVRDHLRDEAVTEALRKQGEVIGELERLLAILRDRRSVENLDQEIATAEQLSRDAAELTRRQEELQQRTRAQGANPPSPAEQALADALAALEAKQRAEAERNRASAGLRAPFFEAALQRVQQLLERQTSLEQTARHQLGGNADRDPARAEAFRLGELEQGQRDLVEAQARSRALARAAQAARELQQALQRGEAELAEEARQRTLAELDAGMPPADPRESGTALTAPRKQLADAETPDLQTAAAEQAEAAAAAEAARLREATAEARARLEKQAAELAQQLAEAKAPQAGSASESVAEAAKALNQANELSKAAQDGQAMARMADAARALAEARQRHKRENPDAAQTAGEMASEAGQVARELRKIPEIDGEAAPEKDAAAALTSTETELRTAAEQLAGEQPQTAAVQKPLQAARQGLEQARDQLQRALASETSGRQAELEQAAERQQQLEQQAAGLRSALDQAENPLPREQREAATPALDQARDLMKQAAQDLQGGNQASAADKQAEAADALQQANDAARAARPLTEDQKAGLQELSPEQKQLEEAIIRLAQEMEQRKNRQAQAALQQAAQAANQASKAMEEGDADEADAQQQQARDRLQEAQEALEQERDRYQDLRQEELLFRIRDELTDFLERQRTLTGSTKEAATALGDGSRMTRRVRRQLNELGQREQELSGKADYLRTAIEQEGSAVFGHVLEANREDLEDVARRLAGNQPDPGPVTVMLQQDVEARTVKLLDALRREQERRREQQQQQQQPQDQQPQPGNQTPQRQRLVPVLAELQMLRQMEQDLLDRTDQLQRLFAGHGGDSISEVEVALLERLAHRHNAVTQIFLSLKGQLEQSLASDQASEATEQSPEKGK